MKTSFKINIDQSILDDFQNRIADTRWADELENAGWEYGANETYCEH
jgi:hypothetical protein